VVFVYGDRAPPAPNANPPMIVMAPAEAASNFFDKIAFKPGP
jgi:hypothetical protein